MTRRNGRSRRINYHHVKHIIDKCRLVTPGFSAFLITFSILPCLCAQRSSCCFQNRSKKSGNRALRAWAAAGHVVPLPIRLQSCGLIVHGVNKLNCTITALRPTTSRHESVYPIRSNPFAHGLRGPRLGNYTYILTVYHSCRIILRLYL